MTNLNGQAALSAWIARAAARSRKAMMLGLVFALGSSTIVDGALPALVLSSVLAPVWISLYSTLTTLEDFLALFIVPILGRFKPGRTLLACEVTSGVLLASLGVALGLGVPTGPAVLAFLAVSSPIPLVLDVADELYGAELADVAPEKAFAFTAHLHSLTAFITKVLAVPIGSALTLLNPLWLVFASLSLTLFAIIARFSGVKWEERALAAHLELSGSSAAEQPRASADDADVALADTSDSAPQPFSHLFRNALVSPVSVGLRSIAAGLIGTYVYIYIGNAAGQSYYFGALIAAGLGGVLGPQLARVLRARFLTERILSAALLVGALMGAAVALLTLWASGLVFVLYVFLDAVISWGVISTLIAERQLQLSGRAFITATTWSHAAGAFGAMFGSWGALVLGTQTHPQFAIALASLCYLLLAVYIVQTPIHHAR